MVVVGFSILVVTLKAWVCCNADFANLLTLNCAQETRWCSGNYFRLRIESCGVQTSIKASLVFDSKGI